MVLERQVGTVIQCAIGFLKTLCIESLEINGTVKGSIGFGYNDHGATPDNGSAYGDRFDYASLNFSVQAGLDLCFPVMRYRSWGVSGMGDSIRSEMYLAVGSVKAGNGAPLLNTLLTNFSRM